eukprot:jgi/Mesvir1/735/Mv17339-RA.2
MPPPPSDRKGSQKRPPRQDPLELCDKLYRDMRRVGLAPDSYTLSSLVNAFSRGLQPDRAQAFFDELTDASCRAATVGGIEAVNGAGGAGGGALAAPTTVGGGETGGAVDAGGSGASPPIPPGMPANSPTRSTGQAATPLPSPSPSPSPAPVVPNRVARNTLLAAWARVGDAGRVLAGVAAMRRAGVEPDEFAYHAMIQVCGKCGQASQVWEAYHAMVRARVPLTPVTFNSLIRSFHHAGDIDSAYAAWQEMRLASVPPNERTVSTLMEAFVDSPAMLASVVEELATMERDGELAAATPAYHRLLRLQSLAPAPEGLPAPWRQPLVVVPAAKDSALASDIPGGNLGATSTAGSSRPPGLVTLEAIGPVTPAGDASGDRWRWSVSATSSLVPSSSSSVSATSSLVPSSSSSPYFFTGVQAADGAPGGAQANIARDGPSGAVPLWMEDQRVGGGGRGAEPSTEQPLGPTAGSWGTGAPWPATSVGVVREQVVKGGSRYGAAGSNVHPGDGDGAADDSRSRDTDAYAGATVFGDVRRRLRAFLFPGFLGGADDMWRDTAAREGNASILHNTAGMSPSTAGGCFSLQAGVRADLWADLDLHGLSRIESRLALLSLMERVGESVRQQQQAMMAQGGGQGHGLAAVMAGSASAHAVAADVIKAASDDVSNVAGHPGGTYGAEASCGGKQGGHRGGDEGCEGEPRLVIITGRGHNSWVPSGGGPVVRESVMDLLNTLGVPFEQPIDNQGRILVRRKDLVRHALAMQARLDELQMVKRVAIRTLLVAGTFYSVVWGVPTLMALLARGAP